MSEAQKMMQQLKEQGISREVAERVLRTKVKDYLVSKGMKDVKDDTINKVMEARGFNKDVNLVYGMVDMNTRWNAEAAKYGDKYSSYLKDRYAPMLESAEGREEFKSFAKDRLQASDQQIADFMGTLDKDTKDETWRKYYRAGMEGIGQAGTGIMQTVNDLAGLFGLEAFDQEQLDKDRGDYDYIESMSESRYDFDWTDPKNYVSPEALRNVAFIAPYVAMETNMANRALKNVATAGRMAKTAAYALPGAAVTYTQARAEKDKAEAGIEAALTGGVGAVAGNLFDAGRALIDAWNGEGAVKNYVEGIASNPARLDVEEAALKKAEDLDLILSRDMLPDQIAYGETARAALKNIAFKSKGSQLVDYNSSRLFKSFMTDLDKLGVDVDHNKIAADIKKMLSQAKDPERELYSSIRNTYNDRGLYQGDDFKNAMADYLEKNKQAASQREMQKIMDYVNSLGLRTYADADDFLKELKDPDTKNYILGTMNNQAKKDFAEMFDKHVLKKTLPPEAQKLIEEARGVYRQSKLTDEKFANLSQYFAKDTDQARELFPLSSSDSKVESKLDALATIRELADKEGSDIAYKLVADYMRSRVQNVLRGSGAMQELTHPVQKVGKAFERMDERVFEALLPKEKADEFKAYSQLFQSVAAEAKKYKVQGGALGQAFDILNYAAAQTVIAPQAWLFSKMAGRDLKKDIRMALDNIRQGRPKEALEKVAQAFPDAARKVYESHSLKNKTGQDKLTVYSENKNLNRLASKAGLENPKTYSSTKAEGAEEVTFDGSKVMSLEGLKSYNPNITVDKLLQNPVLLRALQSRGYEAVVLAEKDGVPSRVLDLRGESFNPQIAEQRKQIIGSFDINRSIEKTPKITKQPLIKDSSQPTPDNIIDVKSGELVENKPAPAPTPKPKLTAEQRKSLKTMESLRKQFNKIADMPDESKKVEKFLANRQKSFDAQAGKMKELKQLENDEALREEWEKTIMAAENARIKLKEARDAAEKAKTKRESMDKDNAAKRQKTLVKNQSEEIMTENTNLETQDFSRFVAENGYKYKSIDEIYEAYKAEKAKPEPSEPFTVNKKTKNEQPKQEKPKKEKKPKAPKAEPKKEEPKVEPAKEEPKVEPKKEEPKVEPKKEEPKVERNKYKYSDATEPVAYDDKTPDAYSLPDLKELRQKGIDDEQAAIIQKALDENEWEAGTSNRNDAVMALRIYKSNKYKQDFMDRADPRDVNAEEWSKFTKGGMPEIKATPKDFGGGDSGMKKEFDFRNLPNNEVKGLYYMIAKQPESYNKSHEEILKEAKDLFTEYMHKFSSASPDNLSDNLRKRKSEGDDHWTGD